MTEDRELLQAAARAAGLEFKWEELRGGAGSVGGYARARKPGSDAFPIWRPLTDDGDALRLAVALGLVVDCSRPSAGEPHKPHAIWRDETMSNAELTRRAIVRAAAAIAATPAA